MNALDSSALRSILFMPHQTRDLFSGSFVYGQLDAVAEILDFCNSYVLNDVVSVPGYTFEIPRNSFARFVASEIASTGAVETIGYNQNSTFDITPFDELLGLPEYERRLRDLHRANEALEESLEPSIDFGPQEKKEVRARELKYNELADEARVVQQQSYILLADSLRAMYVPERLYGRRAIKSYSRVLQQAPHLVEEEFRNRLSGEIESLGSPSDIGVRVPSFFVEALRQSETQDGIWNALRDLRQSKAADTYRHLVKITMDNRRSWAEIREARKELRGKSDVVFSGESLKSRVPRWVKYTVALSPIAVGALFPPAALVVGIAPVALKTIDEIDRWFRRRANIFEIYSQATDTDLFQEIKRLFPNVKFGAEHLAYFLKERNFGWPESLNHNLYGGA